MSTRTANYGLHQWAGEDKFLRTDFNEDNAKADAAIKAAYDRAGTVEASLTNKLAAAQSALNAAIGKKADTTALTALQNTVKTKAEIVWGSYVGDGVYPRTINVGFRPKVVFVETKNGRVQSSGYDPLGGMFTADQPLYGSSSKLCTAVTDTGFSVLANYLNQADSVYYYFCVK